MLVEGRRLKWLKYCEYNKQDENCQSHVNVIVPTLWTIMNSSYYYEYQKNTHLSAYHFGSQIDSQHSFTYAVFRLSFNVLVLRNLEFMSFFRTFYWSATYIIIIMPCR